VKRLALVLGLAAIAACGNDNPSVGNDAPAPGSDAGSNAGSDGGTQPPETLTAFVIDLVTNHTTATELPQPYSAFSTLADPDATNNNLAAYQSLFP
jgi:hypothetical protein